MQIHFSDAPLKYDGAQLRSHFAYRSFGILGDSVVSFVGGCEVKSASMVDLEDSRRDLFIYSENMLHFIVERFDLDLNFTIALQRLLIADLIQEIQDGVEGLRLTRRGNDVYDEHQKLSVSIATLSPVSSLIHVGVNVSSENTPVPTKGLDDYGLNPQAVAIGTMNRFREEIDSIARARAKVRGVP